MLASHGVLSLSLIENPPMRPPRPSSASSPCVPCNEIRQCNQRNLEMRSQPSFCSVRCVEPHVSGTDTKCRLGRCVPERFACSEVLTEVYNPILRLESWFFF